MSFQSKLFFKNSIDNNKCTLYGNSNPQLTCNSRIITFRLLPCKTTCACETNSSGTNGAGTVTKDLPDELLPIITPAPRELEPLPWPLLLRTDVVRILIRARDLANCLDALVVCFAFDDGLFDAEVLLLLAPPFLYQAEDQEIKESEIL